MAKKYYDGESVLSESVGNAARLPKDTILKNFTKGGPRITKVYDDSIKGIDAQIKADTKFKK